MLFRLSASAHSADFPPLGALAVVPSSASAPFFSSVFSSIARAAFAARIAALCGVKFYSGLKIAQQARGGGGEISQNARATGALKSQKRFQHRGLLVEKTARGGGFDHRVFARHLIGENRRRQIARRLARNIQIRHAGLDNYGVRAFGQIEPPFARGFAQIGGIHLVGFLSPISFADPRAERKGP